MKFKERKRRILQVACALVYNCHLPGFFHGRIYQGASKSICVPGLNCYSCPGAVASCPVGSLQTALVSARYKIPCYIVGLLLLAGVIFGRVIFGYLCPFGLLQELLYRIPSPKIRKGRWSRRLSLLKYGILIGFVVLFPILFAAPGFCKYLCPAGTLEAGLPLTAVNFALRRLTGVLFTWKTAVLAVVLVSAVLIFRSFCRFLCPLGAFYSLFHKIACLGVEVDKNRCTSCRACVKFCKMDVQMPGDRECIQCGECRNICQEQAVVWKTFRNPVSEKSNRRTGE